MTETSEGGTTQRQRQAGAGHRAPSSKNFLREILNRDPPSLAIRRSSVAYRHVAGAVRDGDLVPIRGISVVRAIQLRLTADGAEVLIVER